MAPVYVVTSEDHDNDYKRAETTSSVVGVFSSREGALKVALLSQIEAMHEYMADADSDGDSVAEEVHKFCDKCKGGAFDVSKMFTEAQALAEKRYGEPEFGMKSSGCRVFVQEVLEIDQTINGELFSDLETDWENEISGLESYISEADRQEFGLPGGCGDESEEDTSSQESEDFEGLEEMEQDELTSLLQEAKEEALEKMDISEEKEGS